MATWKIVLIIVDIALGVILIGTGVIFGVRAAKGKKKES